MRQYEMFELEFQGREPAEDPAGAEIAAEFVCGDERRSVRGFYDGEGSYKVRFLPQSTGLYTWSVTGAAEASGTEACEASEKSSGMVRAEGTHFVYQNGDKYLPFGTTVYALAHQPEELREQTFATLEKAPFNKVRHCIFPKHYDFNHNDPEFFPFEKNGEGRWDVRRPCYAFWKHFEAVLLRLGAMGIESDLILFHPYDRWGFSHFTLEECKCYLDYAVRRLSAIPCVWWSLANEYDLMFDYAPEHWYALESFLAQKDPYGHLLSNHNCFKLYDFSRPSITHCCVQSIELQKADKWQRRFRKPVIYDECCYEGDIRHEWGNLSGYEMASRFWKACVKGAYASHGETFYSEDEVLWWSKGGALKGESPRRIAFLKELLYSLPGPVEPWSTPSSVALMDDLEQEQPEASGSASESPMAGLLRTLTREEKEALRLKGVLYEGRCGDDVFLKYFERQCAAVSRLLLPEDKTYKVDIIDIWKMTRETLLEEASGETWLKLPGREGIAVIAVRICEKNHCTFYENMLE